jgi:Domain of unknown function (DUF4360)
MKFFLRLTLSSLLFSSMSSLSASANSGLVLGNPVIMSGSGCPVGSVQTTVDPDGTTLSVVFDQFGTKAVPGNVSQRSCNLRIPVKVPQGFQAQLVDMVYRGFADIPSGASGQIVSTAILGGKTVGSEITQLPAGFSSAWELTNSFTAVSISTCISSTVLGVNTSLLARAINASRIAQISTDTLDITAGDEKIIAKFGFKIVSCSGGSPIIFP